MNTHTQKRGASRLLRSQRGFTLTEILVTVAIITAAIGASFAGYTLAGENGKAGAVATAIKNAKDAVAQFANEHGNVVPITEQTVAGQIPVSGTTFSATAAATLANACTLEPVLLTEKCADRAINVAAGPNAVATNSGANDVLWDVSKQAFYMNPDAAPTRDYSSCNRVECRIASSTSPETAAGSNFYLDGSNSIATGRRVVYMVIPNCPASLAYKISRKIDGDNFSTNESTFDKKGAVVYNTPSNGVTTVYIYILDV